MKAIFLLSTVLAVNAAVLDPSAGHTHEKRQSSVALPIGLFSFIWNSQSKVNKAPFRSRKLDPQLFPNAVREQVIWGPFKLEPVNGQHKLIGLKLDKQSDVIEEGLSGLCKECMVLQARAEITDKDGTRLDLKDNVYTHHIIVANLGRMMVMPPVMPGGFTCQGGAKSGGGMGGMMGGMGGMGGMPGMGMGKPKSSSRRVRRSPQWGTRGAGAGGSGVGGFSIFIGKGNEGDSSVFAPINSTVIKSGYWLGKDDKITATAEVVNYKNVPQDVYFAIDMEYLPINAPRPAEYLDVGFGALQISQCGNLFLQPPKDRMITFSSSESTVWGSGYLLNLSPHLHDGALNMKIYLNGKKVCQSDAVYGQDGGTSVNGEKWETITSYTPCLEPIKIQPGDKIKMTSDYDLTKHKLRPDSKEQGMEAEAMAIANFQFAQSK